MSNDYIRQFCKIDVSKEQDPNVNSLKTILHNIFHVFHIWLELVSAPWA
jgi:hypothetical protein